MPNYTYVLKQISNLTNITTQFAETCKPACLAKILYSL